MTNSAHDASESHDDHDGHERQLSEVGRLDPAEADTPVMPDQATSGSPDAESGDIQEGGVGPNGKPQDS